MSTVTVVRPKEVIEETAYHFTADGDLDNCYQELEDLLSSPFASYKPHIDPQDPKKVIVRHHQPYPMRLKITKEQLNNRITKLSDKLQKLEDEHEKTKKINLDWETRSRIAQALNDEYMYQAHIPEQVDLLKRKGYDYFPYVLALWAIYTSHESATRFADKIGAQWTRYVNKASRLDNEGINAFQLVWDFVPATDRNLMVAMWLTRPSSRINIAHPVPTVDEGKHIIQSDSCLLEEEKDLAQQIIPDAVDKYMQPLFIA